MLISTLSHLSATLAFPSYGSLAGLSEREVNEIVAGLPHITPGKPPGPLKFNGTKLVYDRDHPWKPLRRGDIRGPCPGLYTLASHGYLPRDGVATPSQIIRAVQEGFNMDNSLAQFVTYAALLVDGNVVTDLLSIGGKTRKTGIDAPSPAIIGGLNTHAVFEGDSSMRRADAYFGDNHSFNQTLFDQFVEYSNKYGDGLYNMTVAAELRRRRIEQSIATNPQFEFTSPRFFTAYAESAFPYVFFVDGRITNRTTAGLDMTNATLFFRDSKFPNDFWRPPAPSGALGLADIFQAYPIAPGRNVNGTNTYTPDPTSADFTTFCKLYSDFVNKTVKSLYPNPTGIVRRNLNINLGYFYSALPALQQAGGSIHMSSETSFGAEPHLRTRTWAIKVKRQYFHGGIARGDAKSGSPTVNCQPTRLGPPSSSEPRSPQQQRSYRLERHLLDVHYLPLAVSTNQGSTVTTPTLLADARVRSEAEKAFRNALVDAYPVMSAEI
ncbi:heme-thiolate peroxidase [Coprinellus aureogranulatus]|nr:heme-thiolate peroxidase [Coprinellus aureogranulatus]